MNLRKFFSLRKAHPHAGERKQSAAGPLIAIDSGRQPQWMARNVQAFAKEGFAGNAIGYRCVRMISEAAASVPWLLYESEREHTAHPLLRLDDWPRNPEIALPLWPVAAIDTVKVIGEEGAAFLIDEAHYVADLGARPARLVRRPDRHWPRPGRRAGGIEVDFTAGFGPTADEVPQPIRQALKLFIGLLYEDRQALATMAEPATLAALLSPYRDCRL
jgi:uncharacterized phiE125 gp8 family phage protein